MIAKWVMKTMWSNYILNTVAADYSQQAFTHVFRIFQRMCSKSDEICMMMRDSSMHQTEHDDNAIMYLAYATPVQYKGNKTQPTLNDMNVRTYWQWLKKCVRRNIRMRRLIAWNWYWKIDVVEVRSWTGIYIQLYHVDVINYPYTNVDIGWVNPD